MFFVERYEPAIDAATAALLSSRLRAAVDEMRLERHEIQWLRSFALLAEETYVCMLLAEHEDDVAALHTRANLSCEHVVEAVAGEPPESP